MKLATLCYVRQGCQTLMIHRVKKADDMHKGRWNGLGGKLEPGESPEECAIREIYEESGLNVKSLHLKGILTFPGFANEEDWYTFVFVIDQFEGELIDSSEGDLAWIDNDHLFDLNLWDGDRIFLRWLDEAKFFSGKFIYSNGQFIDYTVAFYPQH